MVYGSILFAWNGCYMPVFWCPLVVVWRIPQQLWTFSRLYRFYCIQYIQCTYNAWVCLLWSHRMKRWSSHRRKQLRCVPKAALMTLTIRVRKKNPVVRLLRMFNSRWQEGRWVSSTRAAHARTHAHAHTQSWSFGAIHSKLIKLITKTKNQDRYDNTVDD